MPRTLNWSPKANGATRLVIREEPEAVSGDTIAQLLLSGSMQAARCPCCGQVLGAAMQARSTYQSDAWNAYMGAQSNLSPSLFGGIFSGGVR